MVPAGAYGADGLMLDPFNVGTVWLGVEGKGLYKSTDCGAPGSWTLVSTGSNGSAMAAGAMFSMAIDFQTPGVIYTTSNEGNRGVWKSTNAGVDWKQLFPPTSPFAQTVQYNLANGIAMDAKNAQHLIVSTHAQCQAPYTPVCVAETSDGGTTWKIISVSPPGTNWTDWKAGAGVFILPSTTGQSTFLFATYSDGLWLTKDDGATWKDVTPAGTTGATGGKTLIRPFAPAADGTYYLTSLHGVLKSPDGMTWSLIENSGGMAFSFAIGGGHLFAANQWSMDYSMASEASNKLWSSITPPNAPPYLGFVEGGVYLSYDAVHHVLYSSNWNGGAWRMVMP